MPRGYYGGKSDVIKAKNKLNREFNVERPNQWWVTEHYLHQNSQGFLFFWPSSWTYLHVILLVGSMSDRMTEDLAMQAITAAYWRRKPQQQVGLHSDQGSQYSSRQFRKLLNEYNIMLRMSRRGNCHDNAVAESFSNLKKKNTPTYLSKSS